MSMTSVTSNTLAAPEPPVPALDFETTADVGYYRLIWRRFSARKLAIVALVVLALLAILCYIMPWYLPAPTPPTTSGQEYLPMSLSHPFGTDEIGRDLFLRNIIGGQVSLTVGIMAMMTTIVVATVLGAIAGFFGGIVDSVLSALTNAVLAIPSVLILIAYAKLTNSPTVLTIVVGITLIAWPSTMRIVRAVVLSLREKEYVEAARALGSSRGRIIVRHIIPNALGPIIVSASLTVVAAILLESAISFLGVGIQQPTPSWGSLLDSGYTALSSHSDWVYAFWPGVMIFITVLCFNYIGDALRDAFDPRALDR